MTGRWTGLRLPVLKTVFSVDRHIQGGTWCADPAPTDCERGAFSLHLPTVNVVHSLCTYRL